MAAHQEPIPLTVDAQVKLRLVADPSVFDAALWCKSAQQTFSPLNHIFSLTFDPHPLADTDFVRTLPGKRLGIMVFPERPKL
jgi:hypothetical protein